MNLIAYTNNVIRRYILVMEDSTIKRINIVKRPKRVKLILKKLQRSKKKSNDIKTIIIKPHPVVRGDHKYYAIKKKEALKKKKVGGKPRKKIKQKIDKKINKKTKVKKKDKKKTDKKKDKKKKDKKKKDKKKKDKKKSFLK